MASGVDAVHEVLHDLRDPRGRGPGADRDHGLGGQRAELRRGHLGQRQSVGATEPVQQAGLDLGAALGIEEQRQLQDPADRGKGQQPSPESGEQPGVPAGQGVGLGDPGADRAAGQPGGQRDLVEGVGAQPALLGVTGGVGSAPGELGRDPVAQRGHGPQVTLSLTREVHQGGVVQHAERVRGTRLGLRDPLGHQLQQRGRPTRRCPALGRARGPPPAPSPPGPPTPAQRGPGRREGRPRPASLSMNRTCE